MQTFLPYSNFIETAKCLDNKRLGKQRVEAMQILNALDNSNNKWNKHPIVNMWRNFEDILRLYFNVISNEWETRGYKHNIGYFKMTSLCISNPIWLGKEEFHSSHRAALLAKNYRWYSQFGWKEKPEIKYIWF